MKASFRRGFTFTDYDAEAKLWLCAYKSWKKSILAGHGKTPEEARARLMELVKKENGWRETVQDNWG